LEADNRNMDAIAKRLISLVDDSISGVGDVGLNNAVVLRLWTIIFTMSPFLDKGMILRLLLQTMWQITTTKPREFSDEFALWPW